MRERGATEEEVEAAIREGERFSAKFARKGFPHNFRFDGIWRGHSSPMKQIEVIATYEDG
jgi:hypothetical protein